jgi:hypothetical protein
MNSVYRSTHGCYRSDAICDYLDVTCAPTTSFMGDLTNWLALHSIECISFKDGSSNYLLGLGVLKLSGTSRFHRASASGGFIDGLRERGLWRDYVNLLGTVEHKVTRLDVAVDVSVDAPVVLSALESHYSTGEFHFGNKAVRISTVLTRRPIDNAVSGTWYAGSRNTSARVIGKVYDKQLQLFDKHGILSPPLTRFELTFRKDFGASLWDVLSPTDIFYSHAEGLMGTKGVKYDDWASRGLMPWVSVPIDKDFTVERFERTLLHSVELRRYAELAARNFGEGGSAIVLKCFATALNNAILEVSPKPTASDSEA